MKKSHGMRAVIVIVSITFIWLHMCWNTSEENVFLGADEMNVEENDWRLWVGDQDEGTISLPASIEAEAGTVVSLQKQISRVYKDGIYICFRSSESRVKVYVNDILHYTYGVGKTYALSKSPGSAWNLVRIERGFGTYKVRIVLESPYRGYAGKLPSVYIGSKTGIIASIIKWNLPIFLLGFLCIIVSIVGLTGSFMFKSVRMKYAMYFTFLTFLIGIQFIIESKLEQLAVRVPYMILQLDYVLITIFPIMILLYITATEEYKDCKYLKMLRNVAIVCTLLIAVLVFSRMYDFVEIAPYIMVMWFLILTGCIGWQCIRLRNDKNKWNMSLRDMAINIFLVTGLHDMTSRFVACEADYFSWYPIGIILFVSFLLAGHEKEFKKMYLAKLDDEKYRVLAYTDGLTGLKNRVSFEEMMEELRSNQDQRTGYIIMIDVNGLKDINDTLGHKYGDEAICRVARAIEKHFSEEGNCYRIGGDEFCIIINKKIKERVHSMLDALTEEVSNMRLTNEFSLSVASGYAQFAPNTNETVDDVLIKADERMYLCKRHMKEMEKLS